jgi:hypothetical protein
VPDAEITDWVIFLAVAVSSLGGSSGPAVLGCWRRWP